MFEVIESEKLSISGDKRYVVVDQESGEILDDAQGYGYKSKPNAYKAFAYKNRDKSKDALIKQKKAAVKAFCKENKDFVEGLEDDAFQIAKGSFGPEDKFNATWIKNSLAKAGFKDLPFTAGDFLKYW